jgi:hypothetical protein
MVLTVVVLGCGTMMLAAMFIEPLILPAASSGGALHGWAALEGGTILIGSLALGEVIALAVIGGLARRYLSPDVHQRWVEQFENGRSRLPAPHRWIGSYFIRITRPTDRLP